MRSVLVFAHVPPPHHGQSYMVAQLLEELRARPDEIRLYHVNNQVSARLQDVGAGGVGKIWKTLAYCLRAIYLRLRHGPMIFYYVPAPAKRGALFRDWIVMFLCRPFFRTKLVLHWHAVGLGQWLAGDCGRVTSWMTGRLLGEAALSLVLAPAVAADAAVLHPRQVRVLPNGISDPCPDFDDALRSTRLARTRERRGVFRVLFLAHCTREKGLYDALTAVFAAQIQLGCGATPVQLAFTVAGDFLSDEERKSFAEAVAHYSACAANNGTSVPTVEYAGFADGPRKDRLFRESDCFCFPTYYPNEVMPVALIEALAYGLPIVATRWRAIPSMLPATGCWLVEPHHPEDVGAALVKAADTTGFAALRTYFVDNFRREVFGRRFCDVLAECFPEDAAGNDPGK